MKAGAIVTVLLLACTFSLTAQEEGDIKTGWNFGVLPAVTFDSDLGFQYGGLINLYHYGDGSNYPEYNHSLYFEASTFTKGSGIFRFSYDSKHLIPGIQVSTDLAWLPDEAYDFYGFNGYNAVYNPGWTDDEDPAYLTRMFYRFQRKQFRFKNDFQGKLSGNKLKWNVGFALNKFNVGSVDIDKLNEGKDAADLLPAVTSTPGLFELYQTWGIISPEEADGGWVNTLKAGLVYDTRDNIPNPMSGMWTEAGLEYAPEFLGGDQSFAKFYLTHRQYFTLIPEDLSFAYRVGFQSTISGETPFYYQSQVITSILRGATSEGLGGGKSVRGVLRNRVIGDGFLYGNFELRWKAIYFNFINQNWYLGLNLFTDWGRVVKEIETVDYNTLAVTPPSGDWADYFKDDAEKFHLSSGVGLRLAMNRNFIIAVDLGKAFNEQDGNIGFYMGLNYIF